MKTLIIVFSQTGYTLKTGKCIRDGIISVSGQCDMVELADVETNLLADYDLVGLGCPVYYYQEPYHVADFIDDLPELNNKHWFVFCSHGAVMGITLKSMAERLEKKGVTVTGYFDIYADSSLPFAPHPGFTTGHPDKHEYDQARSFGKEVIERTQRIIEGDSSLIPASEPVDEEWAQEAVPMTCEVMSYVVPPFSVVEGKCIHCYKCEKCCPVKGISVESDPRRIQDPCIYCLHCVMVCPVVAIEADWSTMAATNPVHMERTRIVLNKAEAQGRFRWLMDPDSVDYDDIMIKQRERKLKEKKSKNT